MAIQITPQIKTYASGLASVGSRMKLTSSKFGTVSERTALDIDEIKEQKDDYLSLLSEFKSQQDTLVSLKVPGVLKKENDKLILSFNKYVEATELAINSLDVENVKTDEVMLRHAQDLQWEASREIVKVSNIIAAKLGI